MTRSIVAEALDLPALVPWLVDRGLDVIEPLSAQVISGGRSNLTFFVSDGGGKRWVLRRPPLGSLLEGAHDIGRECRVVSALADTSVPVPRVLGFDVDADSVPFYVMEEVAGLVIRDGPTATASLAREGHNRVGPALAKTLATLHSVDPDTVGLGTMGRGVGYLPRQVSLWQRHGERYGVKASAAAATVRDRLLATLPEQREVTMIHGDFRLDNAIVGPDGDVRAILDWELCTRGDPLADLGVFLYYWTESSDPVFPFPDPPTAGVGWPSRAALLDEYSMVSGRTVGRMSWYLAFAAWRLALAFVGIAGRSANGAYANPNAAEERRLTEVSQGLLAHAGRLLDEDER
jgi:aminoglycoside phosphotransferase (APT) family kinase protein